MHQAFVPHLAERGTDRGDFAAHQAFERGRATAQCRLRCRTSGTSVAPMSACAMLSV